jgi:hypothetical protein
VFCYLQRLLKRQQAFLYCEDSNLFGIEILKRITFTGAALSYN